jgi:hypothetical protein
MARRSERAGTISLGSRPGLARLTVVPGRRTSRRCWSQTLNPGPPRQS